MRRREPTNGVRSRRADNRSALDTIVRLPYDNRMTTVLYSAGIDGPGRLDPADMDRLIERHITAEMAGDTAGAVAVYTDDVEHDVVGSPTGPVHGKAAA